ncbi:peptide ligase PGM1-related protein [Streptomyces sp. Isolate_45]|uniref:preATP grasp domain-containing protein n=1 Tax=Streptomyces sp. Isolate_45 TaxID=2950111 RepID=UPI002481C807|nr:peptide ligase PGM1-related protein [Streptomyces sp. Isolate_45]MDA5285629.1 peptide ligase PGM1-related protein [Streptomyces sp. Isolate_45]
MDTGPVVVFANFLSDLAVDLDEGRILTQWAQQAPRKVWLLRPGDGFVTPVPLSREFLRYAYDLTGVPAESVAVIEVPPAGAVPLARAVREAGLIEHVRALAGDRGAALLPTALDASAVAFARDVGLGVHPYPTVEAAEAALRMTMLLNTKAGFRETAGRLGMRLPAGRVCRRPEAEGVARELLRDHEGVVVKPDRSAGGHGMRFVSRDDLRGGASLPLATVGGPEGLWVVEECLDVAESVSVQLEVTPSGPRALFSGAMRTVQGSFTGYVSPLPPSCAHVAGELEEWGTALGRHLADHGYAGPFGLDALVATDGIAYASESNIRRTATTTPHSMITRLTGGHAGPHPAWSVSKGWTRSPMDFEGALARLRASRLAFDPDRGEGVVLYADAPPDGRSWRYAVIDRSAGDVEEQETALAEVLEFDGG